MAIIGTIASGGSIPSTPVIGTAVPSGASASVAFTPSTYEGKGGTVTYTATSTPGGFTGTSTTSPIAVSGLTNGTSYTFKVYGTTSYGVNSLTSAASNAVTPAVSVVTGGTLYSTDATYYYRKFTANGTLGVTSSALICDVMIIAGGGSGGSGRGFTSGGETYNIYPGGGGAGGLLYLTNTMLAVGNQTITIGAGGASVISTGTTSITSAQINGNTGTSTVFGAFTANGGGLGSAANGNSGAGGSGGGGSAYNNSIPGQVAFNGGNGVAGQGFKGGNAFVIVGGAVYTGGGGGAGAAGTNASSGVNGAAGVGAIYNGYGSVTSSGELSTNYYFAGGGASAGGGRGLGGGGASTNNATAVAALVNTGGGGGAARASSGSNFASGAGGSGLVIVRYLKTAV